MGPAAFVPHAGFIRQRKRRMDPAIVVFGFGVGFLVGMTGMGGGSLMTPLLILLFGIQPVTAIGTDIFYASITKTVGGWRHLKLKTVNLPLVFWMACGSVPAAIAGVWAIELLQSSYGDDIDKLVLGVLAGALIVTGVATLIRAFFLKDRIPERESFEIHTRHKVAAVGIGATTGFVIGMSSAGSGTLIAIMLIAVFRLTPQKVVGTDVVHAAVLLGAAAVAHVIGGNVDFGLAGNIILGSVPGVVVGSQLSVKWPQGVLRVVLALVLIAAGITLFHKADTSVLPWALGATALGLGALFAAQLGLRREVEGDREERREVESGERARRRPALVGAGKD
jgi:uncharacterized membrane protein YfcA